MKFFARTAAAIVFASVLAVSAAAQPNPGIGSRRANPEIQLIAETLLALAMESRPNASRGGCLTGAEVDAAKARATRVQWVPRNSVALVGRLGAAKITLDTCYTAFTDFHSENLVIELTSAVRILGGSLRPIACLQDGPKAMAAVYEVTAPRRTPFIITAVEPISEIRADYAPFPTTAATLGRRDGLPWQDCAR